jgi:hypothetical protein
MKWTPGQTVVSIEFDDATSDAPLARPVLASHNMKATFFINSGVLLNSYHMTWSQVHELYAEGHEIAGHTVLHPHLTQLSGEEAKREICNDRNTLLNQGFQPTDFAYPFGDYNNTVKSLAQECGYNTARDVNGVRSPSCQEESCPFAETIPPPEPYATRTPQNIVSTDSLANIQGYVTQAEQHGGGWVQLVFHHICNQCDTYSVTEPVFNEFINWLATQKNTTTATMQQVIGGPLKAPVPGPEPVNLPGPNLMHNASLEEESLYNFGVPTGWEPTSYGTNTAIFTRTGDAHSGTHAERLEVTNFQSGAARLLSKMDLGEHAPTPKVGDNYDVNAYYKSTAPVLFYVYLRDQMGQWQWWTNGGLLPASSTWTKGTFTTPPIPSGTTGISIGLGIQQAGTLTTDDYSLVDRGVIPPPTNVLRNPGLEELLPNGGGPVCWTQGGYSGAGGGGLTGSWSNTTDAHSGTNAELATITAYKEGDLKLISQQDATLANPTLTSASASSNGGSLPAGTYYYEITGTSAYGETLPSNELSATTTGASGSVTLKWPALSGAVTAYKIYRATASGKETLLTSVGATATSYTDTGSATPGTTTPPASNTASKVAPCAPAGKPGDVYQGSAWYKSSAGASVRLIVYYRDATGNWVFWKSQPVPASTTWTQATVLTEALPPGATALGLGASLYSTGTLTTDDLSLGDATAASASDPPPCGSDVCDTTPPASSASSPAYSTSQTFSISYAAADNPGGSGLARVDLYVKGPGDPGYTLAASNPGYATSGVFSYAALEGDGSYSFYTVATDVAGNSEKAPLSPETTTVVDTTPPLANASAPAFSNSKALTIAYTAADATSGVARVDLYAQAPGQSAYTKVASDTSGSSSGSFPYTAAAGDGAYNFYTVATDKAGNVQATPASANATTLLDTVAPASKAGIPALSNSTSLTVSYTAADNVGGSGVAKVDLYAQGPGQSAYTKAASDTSGSSSGSFAYTATAGDGSYSFYTVATDKAGNAQATPASATATTQLDSVAPSSKASAPALSNSTSLTVSYTAADNVGGSGLAEVDLYAQAPGQSGYAKVASDTSGSSSGSFFYTAAAGDGSYSFYTVATDKAGNVQATPASANATTQLDSVAPGSKASAPALSNSTSLTVSYTAADNSGGSGLAKVDLYAQAPGQSGYAKVATDTSGSGSGAFSYTAAAGDGSYSFYTIATDKAGNVQATPTSPNATTLLDTAAPTSKASAPAFSNSTSLAVPYTASDHSGGSGLAKVDLYVQGPGQSAYAKVATDTSGSASGSFSYTAAAGDGSYSFYTIATNKAGNVQATPTSPNATTLLDTVAPTSKAGTPALSKSTSLTVSYTATDSGGGSGLAEVDLYAQGPGQSAYTKVASDTSGSASGSFAYTAAAGDGAYNFYTVATDKAGNVQATPASPNATTQVDTLAPTSSASGPAYSSSTSLTISYSASDNSGGSGLAEVDLYAQRPGQSAYAKVASDTSGSASGSFAYTAAAGDGSYSFYTVATDKAGNVQATPASPNAVTVVDTAPPTSSASAPVAWNSTSLSVSYTASDAASGVARVDLYAQAPGQSAYTKVASDTSGGASGSFAYTAAAGDGTYSFYTVATDKAGNVQATPASANATTLLDTVAPTSKASAPATDFNSSFTVTYSASDNSGGSGLAKVDLYAQAPGQSAYTKVASDTSGSSSGSFKFSPTAGDGTYSFYTVATDRAGNVQATPAGPDATTAVLGDVIPPTSSASSPALSASTSLTVSYTASDNVGGSGLAEVDLYAQAPGQSVYTKVASDTSGSSSGSFAYTAAAGDGSYAFYTVATDKAGNVQAAPASPNTTTLVDTAPPASKASAPPYSSSASLTVSYTASDTSGGSGLAEVDLYAQAPGQSAYTKVASDTSGSASGSFAYTAAAGDGSYSFYTVATDKAGNAQAAPSSPNATTQLDTVAPSSSASAPASANSSPIAVSYTAADNSGGSGLAKVDLYAEGPGQSVYAKVASDTSGSSAGSFNFSPAAGDGTYSFYTVATDKAGNAQAAPSSPNATTLLDTVAPSSKAMAPALSNSTSLTIGYTATDATSGVARVDLYAQAPGQSGYAKVASDTSGSSSGSFSYTAGAGDGTYSFYTVATDKAGNVQATPASANATTLLDTVAPSSKASAPAYSSSASLTISYTSSDTSGGSGLAEVDLYAQGPGQSIYTKVASDTSGSTSGSFAYTAASGDGTYSFYTVATDKAGNVQAAPSSPNATTQLDTVAPSSSASAPASASSAPIAVSYTAADNIGGSGLAEVDLYAQGPGQSAYTKVVSDTSGSASGSFSYAPSAGGGTYNFYTIATDKAGNVQGAPASPNASTNYAPDNTSPTSTASSPTYSNTTTWGISYTASDNGGGDALASVELWARPPGASTYVKAATNTGSATAGSFNYTATAGDGSYAFYTIAVDQAGNRQAVPGTPNATTLQDTVAPSAFQMKSPGQYLRASVKLALSSAPTDKGSGIASVTYQYRPSGTTGAWSTACTATASPWGCSWNTATKATPDGSYELRAVAADRAGNTTVASNTPITVTVQNATPKAKSIATTNVTGGTPGMVEAGDSMTFTYSTTMNPSSILAGWKGAATAVQVKLVAKTATDTTLTVWNSFGTAQLALANPLDLGGNYVPASGAVFDATMVQNGAAITVTLGNLISGFVQPTAVTGGALAWTPSAGATDLAGNKCSTTSVSAPGPAF